MKVAELKAKLSEALRMIKQGAVITVLERDRPVAQLKPIPQAEQLVVHPPRAKKPARRTPPMKVDFDPLAALISDRGRR